MKKKKIEVIPVVKKSKKLNLKEFVALAEKVRKIFEEEEKYLEKKRNEHEDRYTSRFSFNR